MLGVKNTWRNALILFAAMVSFMLAFFAAVESLGYRIGITQSASVHKFVFVLKSVDGQDVSVGDFVSFPFPETTGKEGDVIKRVLAVSGDQIVSRDGSIFINGFLSAEAKKFSAKGRELVPLNSQVVPAGYVFVGGDIPDSYDSRYQEFGLVPVSSIQYVGEGLW